MKHKMWYLGFVCIVVAFFGALIYILVSTPRRGKSIQLEPIPSPAPITVYVVGAVNSPGIYNLPQGSRVNDAVFAAGGLTDQVDLAKINLASIINDGEKVLIPTMVRKSGVSTTADETSIISDGQYPLDINTASSIDLQKLPGIGPQKAVDIIRFREENGPFKEVSDLLNVPGIGEALLEQIINLIIIR